MTDKLKVLGLAVFAVLTIGSSTAQAGEFWAVENTTVTGQQITGVITGKSTPKHEISTVAGTVKCNTATFHGSLFAGSSVFLTLTPSYGGCTVAGIAATINLTGCDYLLAAGETVEGNKDEVYFDTSITCPAEKEIDIQITGSECKITIPQQFFLLTGTAHNNTSALPTDVVATTDATSMAYKIKNGSKCPNFPSDGTYENGTYKGLTTLTGESLIQHFPLAVRVT